MEKIETKDKGDIGLAQVIAHLTKNGVKVALPLSEHLPFDLIAISEEGKLSKVSVKYKGKSEGCVKVPLRTVSTNSKGYNIKRVNFDDIDAFAIYCPDTDVCYFVNKKELFKCVNAFSLRIDAVKDGIKNKNMVHWAKDFLSYSSIFN